jgi:hypothetical protein
MIPRRWYPATLITVLVCASATAQTTQPSSPSPWQEVVSRLAENLRDETGPAALGEIVGDETIISAFGSTQNESRYRLHQQTTGLIVVSARGYTWPAEAVASALASDVNACDPLPDTIRAQFTPIDQADELRCNQTAQQWIISTLQPQAGQFVGVVMLWESKPAITSLLVRSQPGEVKPPVLLLIKARSIGEDRFQILHITYGDVRQALN